jgi:hypothetical protein
MIAMGWGDVPQPQIPHDWEARRGRCTLNGFDDIRPRRPKRYYASAQEIRRRRARDARYL